ncbi:hypothetical protein LPN04_32295 [Rugamonas sp. A1-17]|nr:hypothetical protein [Rugamonas sp. A1-17]
MKQLRYTLLADGSSDAALAPIIDWLLEQHLPGWSIVRQLARELGPVGLALEDRLPVVLKFYPCDLLFVHRDAEKASLSLRLRQIADAMRGYDQVYVPIVPMRMSEAWLLSDEAAIRQAAGNRNGKNALGLPARRDWEGRPDPKADLESALRAASGKSVRRAKQANIAQQRGLVAEYTGDFSALRGLPSFDEFESQLLRKLRDF